MAFLHVAVFILVVAVCYAKPGGDQPERGQCGHLWPLGPVPCDLRVNDTSLLTTKALSDIQCVFGTCEPEDADTTCGTQSVRFYFCSVRSPFLRETCLISSSIPFWAPVCTCDNGPFNVTAPNGQSVQITYCSDRPTRPDPAVRLFLDDSYNPETCDRPRKNTS